MRLADGYELMVVMGEVTPEGGTVITDMRPATVADLIAALKEQGGKVVDTWDFGELHPGRYLVFRIDEEGEK